MAQDNLLHRFALWLASVTAKVDDAPGWTPLNGRPHDYDAGQIQELYWDALTAWRKNPIAQRIIAITTDFVVGDKFVISSPIRRLQKFIEKFWNHPQNHFDLRLEEMCDELSRAGDLFPVLFPAESGLSYIRFITKEQVIKINTAPNDWETELSYNVAPAQPGDEPRTFYNPAGLPTDSPGHTPIMLHYTINRPMGAQMGESDLTSIIPWLQRYSRMLEDRVRLHWAMRAFLWVIEAPANLVEAIRARYKNPPESGSVIVKEAGEKWEVLTPNLHGADAQHDMKAVRQMIDAGSSYPPHWRGEPEGATLATAQAMQVPTERHLARRQKYFVFMLQDILHHAYRRAAAAGTVQPIKETDYAKLFVAAVPDVSRNDNQALAAAGKSLAEAFKELADTLPGESRTLKRLFLQLAFSFIGKPVANEIVETILTEAYDNPRPTP